MVSKILAIDVLAVGLIVFSLGTTLTRRIGRTIHFAQIGGFVLGATTFVSFVSSMPHQPNFHMPPDWFIAMFLSGPSLFLGFVLGGMAGFVGDECTLPERPTNQQVQRLCDTTRHLWTIGLSIVGVGVALGMPGKISVDESENARFVMLFSPILLWLGVGLTIVSSMLTIWGWRRIGTPFRRIAMIEWAFELLIVAAISVWQFVL